MKRLTFKLNLPRLSGRKRFAAVDFDSRELRIALAEATGEQTRVTQLIRCPLGEGFDFGDPLAMGELLGETLRKHRYGKAGVVMCVPRSEAVLKALTLPAGTADDELADMVRYQVEMDLPFPVQDAVVDYAFERHYHAAGSAGDDASGSKDIGILAVAIRLSVVDYYRHIAEAAGVKLLQLGLRPYANLRCLEACDSRAADQCLALVHVTPDETEIDVIDRCSLAFSRSAVKIVSTDDSSDLDASTRLVDEIARTLRSFEAFSHGKRLDGVVLAGDTGDEPQIAEQLPGRLGLPCRILRPAEAFALSGEKVDSAFLCALGQAVAYPSADRMPFNFISPKRPPVRRDPQQRRAITIGAAVSVALLVMIIGGRTWLGSKKDAYRDLANQRADLKKKIDSAKKFSKRAKAVDQWLKQGRPWLDHWANLSAVLPAANHIYVTAITTGADGAITLAIQARRSEHIAALGKQLTEAGYKFTPDQIKTGNDPHEYLFTTSVRIEVPAKMKIDVDAIAPSARPIDDSSREQFYKSKASGRRRPRGRRGRG